jgi:hypothetical protein
LVITIKPKKSTTTTTRIINLTVGIAVILGLLSALSTGGGMLLQPAAAAPKDDCEKDGGTWVQKGKIGFCFRELKPDECKLEPIPEPQDPPLKVCGGLIVVDPDNDEEEDSSPAEILDSALDFADVDLDGTEDGGGGDGGDGGDGTEDSNNEQQQQSSTQDRTQGDSNVNENTQVREQRQSAQIVTDGGTDGGGNPGPA